MIESVSCHDEVEKHQIKQLSSYHHIRRSQILASVVKMIAPVNRYLDIGCGDGVYLEGNYKGCNAKSAVGLDISLTRLKRASKMNPDFEFVLGNAYSLPFKSESFDFVNSSQLIEHLNKPIQFLQQIARILEAGGWLALDTPSKTNFLDALMRLVGHDSDWSLNLDATHRVFYRMEELVELLSKSGFTVAKIRGVSACRYDIVAGIFTRYRQLWPVLQVFDTLFSRLPVFSMFGAIQVFLSRYLPSMHTAADRRQMRKQPSEKSMSKA
ncbi:MAG: class I SAM-dependent methyltransferase [Candidatus Thorarchaeota archaeon]